MALGFAIMKDLVEMAYKNGEIALYSAGCLMPGTMICIIFGIFILFFVSIYH